MFRYFLPFGMASLLLAPAMAQPTTLLSASNSYNPSVYGSADRIAGVESAGAMTLQQALDLAMQANAELGAARSEIEAVGATIRQAGARPNPELAILLEDTRSQTRESTFQINQTIELSGKRASRITAATLAQAVATAELVIKTADLQANVITAFFDVLGAQERLALTTTSAGLAQRGSDVAARRVVAGKVSPVEETRARVAASSVQLELNQARAELVNARKRLAATWGNPAPRFEWVQGDFTSLPAMPNDAAVAERLARAPELGRARFEVERRRALADVEQRRRTQDITVSLGAKKLGSESGGRTQAIVGVSMPLPLFDRNQGNTLEALRRTDKARFELTATEVRLNSEVSQASRRLEAARSNAELLQRDIVPGAQSAFDAATKGYEFGKFGFLDVLDAQRTLLLARSQYLTSLSEAYKAAADIDRLLGSAPVLTADPSANRP
ncbi:MAG: TolC family protein [Pseudomonadota bacterium]